VPTVSGAPPGPGAPQFLAELAEVLLSEQNVSDVLGIIVNLAASALDEVDGASVSMVVQGRERFETTNASSIVVRDIDQAQYERAEGPCVEAIRTGREVRTSLPVERWPRFSERAVMAGMRSVWSLPLTVKDRTTGALNLYSSRGEPWAGTSTAVARGLAGQAAVVLANAASLASAETSNSHLQEALESRDIIGQAKGILMASQNLSANEAFDILRRASQSSGRKLRDIAAEVVDRLERPPGPSDQASG
jgi:GAF domain-containing protein